MAEKFLTQEQLSVFCSSLAMLLRSGASLSEVSSLFEEDGMDTALRQAFGCGGRDVFCGGGKDRRFPGIRLERF